MNANLLIDALVRQTTVLIAQLATAAGARAALAHTANQRTDHNRIARLSESTTERGRWLWEARD